MCLRFKSANDRTNPSQSRRWESGSRKCLVYLRFNQETSKRTIMILVLLGVCRNSLRRYSCKPSNHPTINHLTVMSRVRLAPDRLSRWEIGIRFAIFRLNFEVYPFLNVYKQKYTFIIRLIGSGSLIIVQKVLCASL